MAHLHPLRPRPSILEFAFGQRAVLSSVASLHEENMSETIENEKVEIPIHWADEYPRPMPANQFMVHKSPYDEILLFLGHVVIPIHGSPKEQLKQANALKETGIIIKTDSVIVLPLKIARQLHAALGTQIGNAKP